MTTLIQVSGDRGTKFLAGGKHRTLSRCVITETLTGRDSSSCIYCYANYDSSSFESKCGIWWTWPQIVWPPSGAGGRRHILSSRLMFHLERVPYHGSMGSWGWVYLINTSAAQYIPIYYSFHVAFKSKIATCMEVNADNIQRVLWSNRGSVSLPTLFFHNSNCDCYNKNLPSLLLPQNLRLRYNVRSPTWPSNAYV